MRLFWEFFTFEMKFRLKSLSTYVYFALWFLLAFCCVAAEDFGFAGNGKVLLNGPYTNTVEFAFLTLYGSIIIAAIFGTAVLRDFQRDTYQLLFTKPIKKLAYLGGRWLGSFVTCLLCFSGLVFGQLAGTLAPWADHTRIAPGHLWWYVQPFLTFVVVQIFFLGSLFFTISALTRKLFVVYVQGIALLVVYFVMLGIFVTNRSLEHFWSGIFDPIGYLMIVSVTRYWTVAEQNWLLLSWSPHAARGVLLINRLLWSGVGLLSLGALFRFFPMSVEVLTARSQGKRAAKARQEDEALAAPSRSLVVPMLPRVRKVFGAGTTWKQVLSLTRLRINNIVRELPFWMMTSLVAAFSLIFGHFAGRVADRNVYPVTMLMLGSVEGLPLLILYAIATFYTGELVWRELDTRFAGIHDALPVKETPDWLSRFFAICFVEFVLTTVVGLCGMIMQMASGYFRLEPLQYGQELYLVVLPQIIAFVFLAFFFQTMFSNKFVGHGFVIGIFVLQPILFRFGLENTLLLPGWTPPYTYSDMNRYGYFVQPLLWSTVYWTSVFALGGVISIAFARRGAEAGWRARWYQARRLAPSLAGVCAVLVLIIAGSGAWYFYNTHVLNDFYTTRQLRDFQAEYERNFKRYEHLPQPKVTAVEANIDLDPEHRSFAGTGTYTLMNKDSVAIQRVFITDQKQSVANVQFDRPFRKISSSRRNLFSIYELATPLAPGETMHMTFNTGYQTRGFRDDADRPELAYNGMFFDSDYFPSIGYNSGVEISDPRRRREEHLGELEDLPARGDQRGSRTNLFTEYSDWITYKTTLSTPEGQIALAPGYLQREWHANGRHYFTYDMGGTHILDFYAYISGRYQVRKETYKGVNLEIYYDPKHQWNVDDIMDGIHSGLDYYQANYSPFQFGQFRVLEFPRYRQFAQSFPNTSPFTETFFLQRVLNPNKDIDFTFFVTAHELAHQWWGHQLIGGAVAGSNMMSESLAEYSALRVMQHRYGDAQMHKFLSHELDGYLRGRSGETRKEPPLALVQREQYVWYQKGSLILYALSDYIGEDKVNLALHNFLMARRYANADNTQSGPYPDTRELEAALRAQTPPDLQYFIDDSFEKITLYDNHAVSATSQKLPSGRYKVLLTVEGKKLYANGEGVETPAPINDLIDVGVFSSSAGSDKPLSVRKERITGDQQTFEFTVDEEPTRAGIDPFNKLIDRDLDDNSIDVTIAKQ